MNCRAFPFSTALSAVVCIISITLSGPALGQDYKDMMDDPSVNFYEVVEAAEAYFETHGTGKGSGWKGYQRWKNANEGYYAPDGNRSNVDPYHAAKAFQTIANGQPAARSFWGNGWEGLGPYSINQDDITGHYAPGLGRIEVVWVDPANDQLMYLGSRSGGFWKSEDGGATWQGGSTDVMLASGVNTLAVDPANSNNILINIRNGRNGTSHGVFQSTDGGNSWSATNFAPSNLTWGGLGSNGQVLKLAYHPTIPNLVFVGTNRGMYRSDNNLATWSELITNNDIVDIAFHPSDPAVVYAYDDFGQGANGNVLRISSDTGQTWSTTASLPGNGGQRVYISTSPVCDDCVWAASTNGVYKSLDMGQNWTVLDNPNSTCHGFAVSDVDTANMIYGYLDLFASTNGGQSFDQVTWWSLGSVPFDGGQYIHADLRNAISVNGTFYVGTDGLMCGSSDAGQSWDILSVDAGIRENYLMGISQSNHWRTIIGSQDNGTSIKYEGGWLEFYGADGMAGAIHPLNDDWMVGSTQNGGRRRTLDGGYSQSGISPPGHSSSWEAPLIIDPTDHMTLYHFGASVHRSDDFGDSWDIAGDHGLNGAAEEAAIAINNSDIMVTSRGSTLKLSTDAGTNWTTISGGLPPYAFEGLTFDPRDDSTIIVTMTRYNDDGQKIFVTHNLGQSWENISHNLGDMPIHSVAIDHSATSNIYVGAEIGIYTMPMGGTSWTLYNPNFPNCSVRDLQIMWGSNTLRAATWGRGLWEYVLLDRGDYPVISTTQISNTPTQYSPKEGSDQWVTSTIYYDNALQGVYVRWSDDEPVFDEIVGMHHLSDSLWKSDEPLPNYPVGTKVFFKVFAVGENQDTTETYQFMYEVKPFEYCDAIGDPGTGSDYINLVEVGDISNSSDQDYYGDFTDQYTEMWPNQSYDVMVQLNTHWEPDTAYVWVDFDRDAEFEDEELTYMSQFDSNHQAFGTIEAPDFYIQDTVRMRVRSRYWNAGPDPCGEATGEVEDYSVILHGTPLSTGQTQPMPRVELFPNPARESFQLQFATHVEGGNIQLLDLAGKLVRQQRIASSQTATFSLHEVRAGFYLVRIETGKGVALKKIVVEH